MNRVSTSSVRDIVKHKRNEYLRDAKSGKKQILDDLEASTGYHREALARLLRKGVPAKKTPIRRPRNAKYSVILPQLKILWATSLYACGKRLAPFLPELVSVMKRCGEISLTCTEEALLNSISPATIDRMLKSERASMTLKGRTLTKPGTLLKSKIPVRTFAEWDEAEPGFFEIDLVGHCGGSGSGEFLYTLNMTDVLSGWTVLGAMKGRGERGTVQAIKSASEYIPFAVKGMDSDNDSSFINYHMVKYCRDNQITFTRSREYKKNDQCHVEQKNWSVVRQFIGYKRFETDEQLALLRQVYPLIMKYHNFFSPMMRLSEKRREGRKVTKRYAVAKTPYHRLIDSNGHIDSSIKESLRNEYESLNPVKLLTKIRARLRWLEQMPNDKAGVHQS